MMLLDAFSLIKRNTVFDQAVGTIFYMALLCLSLLCMSCSNKDDPSIEVIAPLNCVYSGDIELDQRTEDILSKYKEKPLQSETPSPR